MPTAPAGWGRVGASRSEPDRAAAPSMFVFGALLARPSPSPSPAHPAGGTTASQPAGITRRLHSNASGSAGGR